MEKSFIAHPWIQRSVVGLEAYSAHDWRAATRYSALQLLGEIGACGYGLLHRRGEMKQRRRIQVRKSHDSVAKNIYGLLQVCSNSIANAIELLQSCTEPLILYPKQNEAK